MELKFIIMPLLFLFAQNKNTYNELLQCVYPTEKTM